MVTDSGYDAAVIGGGIMGCTVALHLARAGMRVVVFERSRLCGEASSRNAGGVTMGDKSPLLIPYAMRGRELRETAPEWRAVDAGYRMTGGLLLAFTDEEAAELESGVAARRGAGAPVEVVGPNRARQIEPGISERVRLATYCRLDGYANSTLTGLVFRTALREAEVVVREGESVGTVERTDAGFVLTNGSDSVAAGRIVLAGGVWLRAMAGWFGLELPILCDVKQQVVTERMLPVVRTVLRAVNRRLSLKQVGSGTVVLGGGWPAAGGLERGEFEIIPESLIGHLRMARHAVPALARARVPRAWIGLEAIAADGLPVVGAVPGVPDAFIIGAVWAGYTIGPYMGRLLGDLILGREPEMPLFDPARLLTGKAGAARREGGRPAGAAAATAG